MCFLGEVSVERVSLSRLYQQKARIIREEFKSLLTLSAPDVPFTVKLADFLNT